MTLTSIVLQVRLTAKAQTHLLIQYTSTLVTRRLNIQACCDKHAGNFDKQPGCQIRTSTLGHVLDAECVCLCRSIPRTGQPKNSKNNLGLSYAHKSIPLAKGMTSLAPNRYQACLRHPNRRHHPLSEFQEERGCRLSASQLGRRAERGAWPRLVKPNDANAFNFEWFNGNPISWQKVKVLTSK